MEKNLLLCGLKSSDLVVLNNGQLLRLYFDKVAFSKNPTWSSSCEANIDYNAACRELHPVQLGTYRGCYGACCKVRSG
jgi:hypothetical protein